MWGDANLVPPRASISFPALLSALALQACGASSGATQDAGPPTVISAGGGHTCWVRPAGNVSCWGLNESGESIPPAGTFTHVAAGPAHSCAIAADQTVACWGSDV